MKNKLTMPPTSISAAAIVVLGGGGRLTSNRLRLDDFEPYQINE
jgi:hypothetical protein